jgi:hypothetical protein
MVTVNAPSMDEITIPTVPGTYSEDTADDIEDLKAYDAKGTLLTKIDINSVHFKAKTLEKI